MKNRLIKSAILSVGILASCKQAISFEPDYSNVEFDVPRIEYKSEVNWLPYRILENLLDYEYPLMWTAHKFAYSPDIIEHGVLDKWENPEEFWLRRRGDCEEFVIMDLYLLKRDFDIEGKLITGKHKITGKEHGWLEVYGKTYEGQYGIEKSFDDYFVYRSYSYSEVMGMVLNNEKSLEVID